MNVARLPYTRMHARIKHAINRKSDATVSRAEETGMDQLKIGAVPRPITITPPEPPDHPHIDSFCEGRTHANIEDHMQKHDLDVNYDMTKKDEQLDMSSHAGLSDNKIAGIEINAKKKALHMIGESSSCPFAIKNIEMSKTKQRS